MSSTYPIPPGEVWHDKIAGIGAEALPSMTIIPTGRFVIGASDAKTSDESGITAANPQRMVRIRHVLAVGIHPVTVAQFKAFVLDTSHESGSGALVLSDSGLSSSPIAGASWRSPGYLQGDQQPVTCVSWRDAQAYLDWLNRRLDLAGEPDAYRLLSEAEWEYACRANADGSAHEPAFGFGHTLNTDQANFNGDIVTGFSPKGIFRAATTKVGIFPANAFGLFDFHGNVWEWCQDVQTNSYATLPDDGRSQRTTDLQILYPGQLVGRVTRGGSWVNDANAVQSAYRSRAEPDERTNYLGFRVARTMAVRG